jgi:XTP/dITP diphosphohydrolase
VLVLARPGAPDLVATGSTEGRILTVMRGTSGFGYDPLFLSDELGTTFGEATSEAKHRVSHRARAVAALLRMPL